MHWQYLISSNGHTHLVPDAQQQQSPLSTIHRNLAYELIKALAVQLFSNWANTGLTCLLVSHHEASEGITQLWLVILSIT